MQLIDITNMDESLLQSSILFLYSITHIFSCVYSDSYPLLLFCRWQYRHYCCIDNHHKTSFWPLSFSPIESDYLDKKRDGFCGVIRLAWRIVTQSAAILPLARRFVVWSKCFWLCKVKVCLFCRQIKPSCKKCLSRKMRLGVAGKKGKYNI